MHHKNADVISVIIVLAPLMLIINVMHVYPIVMFVLDLDNVIHALLITQKSQLAMESSVFKLNVSKLIPQKAAYLVNMDST